MINVQAQCAIKLHTLDAYYHLALKLDDNMKDSKKDMLMNSHLIFSQESLAIYPTPKVHQVY